MGITTNFERKLFFVFGRHIWNVIGVSGFVALLAGCILFFESFATTNLKSKEQYFGRSYATLQSKKEYFGKDYLSNKEILDIGISSGEVLIYEEWIEKMKNKKDGYKGIGNWLLTVWDENADIEYEEYQKKKYQEHVMSNIPKDLVSKKQTQDQSYIEYKTKLLKRKKEQAIVYKDYKNDVSQKNSLKEVRRATSLFPISWGFGVLSFSSVMSTVFSIERNTRKIDPN